MSDQRTHFVTTDDGVTIGGTVCGHGPPVVFLQGVLGDGDLDWGQVVGHLTGRFACYLPSLRGRGLSADHPDLSPGRLVHDFLAYGDSVGEPIKLVGWSGGANWALVVAAQSDAVRGVAVVEPAILSLADEQDQAAMGDAVARTGELATDGDLPSAARAFAGFPFDDAEMSMLDEAGYFEAAGCYIPNLMNLLEQEMESEDPTADPTVLGAIRAPVAVLLGSDTRQVFAASARYVVDHVPDARIHQIPGAGHAAPLTHPEALAAAIAEFFLPVQ